MLALGYFREAFNNIFINGYIMFAVTDFDIKIYLGHCFKIISQVILVYEIRELL